MRDKLTEQLETLIMRCAKELSAEIIEFNVHNSGGRVLIDILADRFDGGITIDECALINLQVDRAVAEGQWFGDNYTVSVASPGLDRPLKTYQDFLRVKGRRVRVHLLAPLDGKVEHHGDVKDVSETVIVLSIKDKDINLPLGQIVKAVQVIE